MAECPACATKGTKTARPEKAKGDIPKNARRLHAQIVAQFVEAGRQGKDTVTLTRTSIEETMHVLQLGGKRIAELEAKPNWFEDAKRRVIQDDHEILQTLGQALGYVKLYPFASEVDDAQVCVGEHVPTTIAIAAAKRIAELEALIKYMCDPKNECGT